MATRSRLASLFVLLVFAYGAFATPAHADPINDSGPSSCNPTNANGGDCTEQFANPQPLGPPCYFSPDVTNAHCAIDVPLSKQPPESAPGGSAPVGTASAGAEHVLLANRSGGSPVAGAAPVVQQQRPVPAVVPPVAGVIAPPTVGNA